MIYKIYNVIKRKINIIFYIVVIAALLIVTGTFTYSRYTYHYETTVTVTVPATKCSNLGLTLSDCVIAFGGGTTNIETAKSNIEDKGTPDYSTTATTDEGMYAAEDDYGTSYYFRGAVENNYVEYAGYIWRIIRVNGDGSVRMIYDGTEVHANGESSTDRYIGTSAFNNNYGDNTYVGYMTAEATANTYNAAHNNEDDSTIKTYIDSWYEENLIDYEDYLSDEIFCNDRSLYSGTGIGTTTSYYNGRDRLYTNKSPVLTCTNQNDAFTVNDTTNGNGDLTYPIGLITADEVAMAGGANGSSYTNSSYYLYIGNNFWAMTPYSFNSTNAVEFYVGAAGSISYYIVNYTNQGARPVVNLSSDVYVYSGTGTQDDPYQVSLTKPYENTLSNVMLVNSTGESDPTAAISAIEDKGEPDFSTMATTDEGLYAAEDDYGTSYYYRGAVEDNYVEYAGYIWRIIRRNGDGSVRIIMEDVLDYVAYNDEYDSPKYVGYTYGDDDSDEETMRENDNDSTIKQYIDSWYEENLIDYADYLSDTLFCNDRTLSTEYTWSNYFIDDLYGEYSSYQRLNAPDTYSPTLSCSNQLDRYTVSDTDAGNGYLTYPIGLITADEVVMAGNMSYFVDCTYNQSYYLYKSDYWWTMTPSFFADYASMWFKFNGVLSDDSNVDDFFGARPVVNLSSEVLVESGTGTSDDPYIVTLAD